MVDIKSAGLVLFVAVLACIYGFNYGSVPLTGQATLTGSATVTSTCILTLNASSVSFGSLAPLATSVNQTVTASNDGNAAILLLYVNGSAWGGAGTMVSNQTHFTNSTFVDYDTSGVQQLTTTQATVLTGLNASATNSTFFKARVPSGQTAGAYTQTIQFTESC